MPSPAARPVQDTPLPAPFLNGAYVVNELQHRGQERQLTSVSTFPPSPPGLYPYVDEVHRQLFIETLTTEVGIMGVCYYEEADIQIPIGVVIYTFTNIHQLWPSLKKKPVLYTLP